MPATKDVRFEFSRSGGTSIRFDANIWRMTKPPQLVETLQFKTFTKPLEVEVLHLPPGSYKLIGIASILKGVNATCQYELTNDGEAIAASDGAQEVPSDSPEATPLQIKHVVSFQVTA